MHDLLMSGFWGFFGGLALMLGAAVGFFVRIPKGNVAGIMAFGSGVLLSAIAFELMDEAYEKAGMLAAASGLVAGAVIYTLANRLLAKRSARRQQDAGGGDAEGGGAAVAVGALLDGVPESIVIGLSILGGQGVSVAMVAAVFISNVPEGLASAASMREAGRSAVHVMALWGAIAVVCGLSALAGYAIFGGFSAFVIGVTTTVAAGAMLAMIADTMIPEAYEVRHDLTGLGVVAGFLASFALTKLA